MVDPELLRAKLRLLFRDLGFGTLPKELFTKGKDADELKVARFLCRAGKSVGIDNESFLNSPGFKGLLQEARQKGRLSRFFKDMGRELGRKPRAAAYGTKLEKYLIYHWRAPCKGLPGIPSLNHLDRESLATVCAWVFHKDSFNADAVEKTRQRLGLKPAPGKKVHVIKGQKGLKVLK